MSGYPQVGGVMVNRRDLWRRRAVIALRQLMAREEAVTWAEVEAKLADRPALPLQHGIDPHHLTHARKLLISTGEIDQTGFERTRGGREVQVLFNPDVAKDGKRKLDRTIARKRLLTGRWTGWSQSNLEHPQGRMGPAGESVLRETIRSIAADTGYRFINKGLEVGRLLDADVPIGPLDNAAWLPGQDPHGTPTGRNFLVLFEMKNIRPWIYPRDAQLSQLLTKAALIQESNPTIDIVPILVARQVQYLTTNMARDLGFRAAFTGKQAINTSGLEPRLFTEVVDELALPITSITDQPNDHLAGYLTRLPSFAAEVADQWRAVGSRHAHMYDRLRQRHDAADAFTELQQAAINEGLDGPWTRGDAFDD